MTFPDYQSKYPELGFYGLPGHTRTPRDLLKQVQDAEAMGLGNAHGKAHRRVALSAGPEREGYVHNESVLVQIFRESLAPAPGAQPDLVFLPMVCGWDAAREHSASDPAPRLGYFALAQSAWRSERGPPNPNPNPNPNPSARPEPVAAGARPAG